MRRPFGAVPVAVLLAVAVLQPARADDPAWLDKATALLPPGYVLGSVLTTADDGRSVDVAAFPATADDPATPASASDPGYVVRVRLDDRQKPLSAAVSPRQPAPADADADDVDPEVAARAATLPAGTEPCDMAGWSADPDPHGLNVRAEPSAKAAILGRLPAPYAVPGDSEETWFTEFRIIGYRDGWFLIEGATPPGVDYVDAESYPADHPVPYAGRGWVAARLVGAAYAFGGTRDGGLYQAPNADAAFRAGGDGDIEVGNSPKRIFACSGTWALVESDGGVRGWWRGLCSNQVTTCN